MRILYVDVDSLRADHTTPYGYGRNTTPNLARLAKKSVRLDNYFCSDSPCVPARAALTTQRFGITTGAFGHQGSDAEVRFPDSRSHDPRAPFLGAQLINHGYHTAGISCFAERHLAYWFHGNFMEHQRPSLSLGLDEDARDVTNCAIDWLNRRGKDDNWFLMVNYWEPHTDYFVDKEWCDKAAALGPAPEWPDAATIEAHQELYGSHCARDLWHIDGRSSPLPHSMPEAIRNRADFEHLINGYDGETLYWDHHFGRLLDHLESMGLLEDTAIIVSADHGEALGEHGVYAEHAMAHDACHRLPMIIHWPGVTDRSTQENRSVPGLFYSLDLGPTLCDLLGIEKPAGWPGESFAAALRGEPMEGRPYLVFSHGVHTFQRAVRTKDHLYIRTLHPGTYPMDPELLYDVHADPHHTLDISKSDPATLNMMRARLSEWWHDNAGKPGAPPDPMQAALQRGPCLYSPPRQYIERLEVTGRAHLAADLRRRLGDFLELDEALPDHELPVSARFGKKAEH